MEKDEKYGISKATATSPTDLLRIPHKDETLITNYPPFFSLKDISKKYFHSEEFPVVSFRPATTSESISVIGYFIDNLSDRNDEPTYIKPFALKTFLIGNVFLGSEGVFVNPPKNEEGKPLGKEWELKNFLDNCDESNGIWIYQGKDLALKDFGFAPYDSFFVGQDFEDQDYESFCRGGLARVLENTPKKMATNLKKIGSSANWERVEVKSFDDPDEYGLKFVGFSIDTILSNPHRGKEELMISIEDGTNSEIAYIGALDKKIKK